MERKQNISYTDFIATTVQKLHALEKEGGKTD